MWGDGIVGFGTYRYKYESGREGEWFLTGFSPRKANLTLCIMSGFFRYQELLEKLGTHKKGTDRMNPKPPRGGVTPMRVLVAAATLLLLSSTRGSPVFGQVTSNGFLVKHQARVEASPGDVFEALVSRVGLWWDPAHTFSGDAGNLSIDARPGGCFCERFPDGGGVEHMRVVHVAPGELLRMSGALGPLQAFGLAGSLTWKVTGSEDGTTIELSYSVGGFMEGGFERVAPAVEAVLGEQLQRLALFVDTGRPTR